MQQTCKCNKKKQCINYDLKKTEANIFKNKNVHLKTNPAKMAARSEINHSAELNPSIPTPWQVSRPSYIQQTHKHHYYY